MPFNGSGTFNRVYNWTTDASNGVKILAARMDTEDSGFATGLSNCVTRDGQSPATADIPFGGFGLTGLKSGTAASPTLQWSSDATSGWYLVSSGVVALSTASTERLRVDNAGLVGIGVTPTVDLHLEKSKSGASLETRVKNTSNTASSSAMVSVSVGGATAADPTVQFAVSGVTTWTMGIDNSDSDKWKLSASSALGTTDVLTMTTSGALTHKGTASAVVTVAASATTNLDCATSNLFYVTMGTNISTLNLNNAMDGQTIRVLYKQDSVSAKSVVAPSTGSDIGDAPSIGTTLGAYNLKEYTWIASLSVWVIVTVLTNAI